MSHTSLILAAGLASLAGIALTLGVLAFDRLAPARLLRERHDLAVAVFVAVPLCFAIALLPRAPADPVLGGVPTAPAVSADMPGVDGKSGGKASDASTGPAGPVAVLMPMRLDGLAPGLIAIGLGGAIVMAVRLIADLVVLARLRAGGRRVRHELNLSRDLPVAEHAGIAGPMLAGVFRPVILVPAGFALNRGAIPVLEHEIAHARRGDVWVVLGIRLVLAAFWWVWPMRLLLPALDRSREALCDRDAARITGAPRALALALLDAAEAAMRRPGLVLAAVPGRSGLAARIRHLTATGAFNRKDSAMRTVLILPVLAAASLALTPRVGANPAVDAVNGRGTPVRQLDDYRDLDAGLYHAARRGQTERIAGLIAAGADPDIRYSGDGTALIAAVRSGRADTVQALLAAGADPDLGVSGDGTPLIVAAARGNLQDVEMLLAAGADPRAGLSGDGSPLIAAAANGHLDVARRLVAAGADVDGNVPGDETPLINAAQQGRFDMARFLVGAGADVSLTVRVPRQAGAGPLYRSPLSEARRRGHRELADWLVAQGARHNPPGEPFGD